MAIVMSWSKCKIEVGETGTNDAPASSFTDLGTILDKSTELSAEGGDTLEMKSTGGELVGYEVQGGTLTLTTTLIEPSDSLYATLGIGSVGSGDAAGTLSVTSHVVGKEMTVKLTPKNKGAKGILAPKCSVSVAPIYSEENGHQLQITFGILKSNVLNYWYQKFTTTSAL